MVIFSALNIYGAAILAVMMIFYAVEEKSSRYTLLFGGACVGTSIYGFLAGTWPFGVIEAIWAVIAFRKYYRLSMGRRGKSVRNEA